MCGIAGIIRSDERPVDRDVLARMAARLVHRGPDQEGVWLDGAAGLAVRRLAVIDPEGSRQPLSNEDGSVWLAYNGEIYNYRALRADLSARGHTLRSAGDSEVLVHLYEDHGPDLLGHLGGMFAFAVWDGRRRRLLVARDRLGQKPLYWWHGPQGFVFASEVAALLECPDVPREADCRALGRFLRFGYVPAPETGLAGIRKLPPAHYLEFDAARGRVSGPTRYWDIPRGPAESGTSAAEWRERLRAALTEAVRSQLAADVPLGVLLSGGMDSSVVTALAAAGAPAPLRTFTVRFGDAGWDESAYARAVARRFGTDHTEVSVEPRGVEVLGELVERHGEPFADSSSIAMYYLAREARRQVTVALSGDGGDESFGGYPRHAALAMSEGMGPRGRRLLARLGRRMAPRAGRKSRWNAARRFLTALDLDPLPRYLAWRSLFSAEDLAALATPEFAAAALADDPLTAWRGAIAGLESRPWVDRAMAIDLADYLPNDCLAKADVASMRHSLEVRSPMLDHRVVELARRMPADLKWRRRLGRLPQGKAILREAFARDLPPSVLRRRKMGFGVPVSRWLATEHADWMRGILLDRRTLARGLTRRGFVEEMIAAHTALRADYGERLWALVCLELWFRWAGL
ncbi:MAG: asparagine synthase (glutamine-hydrolyzing) [Planctomycetota bacterium]|nr:asparagine synthase (glutamine-hydrolyzing) [Planctomycetota bacterium]